MMMVDHLLESSVCFEVDRQLTTNTPVFQSNTTPTSNKRNQSFQT